MANQEHLDILKQGIEVWNAWREKHPEVQPDLYRAYLANARLSIVNLREADLIDANLRDADLRGADLRDANLSHASLRDARLRDANLSYTNLSTADLRSAFLRRANLSHANLSDADFSNAFLTSAHLIGAHLIGTNLISTNLSSANLSSTNLSGANLSGADLSDVDLSDADLSYSNLMSANLSNTNLSNATMGWTALGDRDLRMIKGLETTIHKGPSPLSLNTIYLSGSNIPEAFLRGTGTPDIFIEYMRSLVGKPIEFYSCFISHSSRDQEFARRLHNDLQGNGVRCWYAPEDLKIGDKFRVRIDESIRLYDKLLLVLSENSLASNWVVYEVEKALNKEPEGTPNVLFPIRLDKTILTCETDWAKDIRKSRHIGDFEHWKDHDTYQQAFQRLLRDLKAQA